MWKSKRHSFCVQKCTFKRLQIILQIFMIVRESLNKSAHFKIVQSLFKTRVPTHRILVCKVWRVNHSREIPHVFDPTNSWFPIQRNPFSYFRVIWPKFCKDCIVTSPTIRCSVRVFIIIFKVKKLLIILVPKRNLCWSPNVTCNDATSNHIH